MRFPARSLFTGGWSLAETLVTVSIVGLFVAVSVPSFLEMQRRDSLIASARAIATDLRAARAEAIARGRNVGVRFEQQDDEWHYALWLDGDFDGIRSNDIRRGIDRRISEPRTILEGSGGSRIAMPATPLRDPDSRRRIPPNASPVRFGRASLCSFSPVGSATAGSLFLTDGGSRTAIVRVYGATGRVRILLWDPGRQQWRSR